MGPKLPGRIPLGFTWVYQSQQDTVNSFSGGPLGGSIAPIVWCTLPAWTSEGNSSVPPVAQATVRVGGDQWTFYKHAAPTVPRDPAKVFKWLKDRGVTDLGTATPGDPSQFSLFAVYPNSDGTRLLVEMMWSGGNQMLAILDGPSAIWTRDGQTTRFTNRWGDSCRATQLAGNPGAPTSMDLSNDLDTSVKIHMEATQTGASSNFGVPVKVMVTSVGTGLASVTATGLANSYQRLGYVAYSGGVPSYIFSGYWDQGLKPDTITLDPDGTPSITQINWGGNGIQSISYPSGLQESFSYEAVNNLSDRSYNPNTGNWMGYKPDAPADPVQNTTEYEDHLSNVPEVSGGSWNLGVLSVTRTGFLNGDRVYIKRTQPMGRWIRGGFQFSQSLHTTSIIRTASANPAAGDPVRGLTLNHAPHDVSSSLNIFMFATSAIQSSVTFTGTLGSDLASLASEVDYQTTTYQNWSLISWANPLGSIQSGTGIPVNPVALTTSISTTDIPGYPDRTVTTVARAYDAYGPTRTDETLQSVLTRTGTLSRHWDDALGELITDSEGKSITDSSAFLTRGSSSADYGTTAYHHDAYGRMDIATFVRGGFTSTETRTYAAGLPVLTSSTRTLNNGGNIPPNWDDPTVRAGQEAALDGSHYGWIQQSRDLTDGRWTSYQRDGMGREIQRTDPSGITTATTYDNRGRASIVTVKDRSGAVARTTTITYDPNELWKIEQVSISDLTLTTRTDFDALGRPVKITYPALDWKQFSYDGWGQKNGESPVLRSGEGLWGSAAWNYDVRGRLASTVDAQGRQTSLVLVQPHLEASRGGLANAVWTTVQDALGNPRTEARSLFGDLLLTIDQLNQWSAMQYDVDGHVVQTQQSIAPNGGTATQPGAQTRSYGYNAMGWLLSRTEPEEGTTTFTGHNLFGVPRNSAQGGRSGTGSWMTTTILGSWNQPTEIRATGPEGTVDRVLSYDAPTHVLTRLAETQPYGTLYETYGYDNLLRLNQKQVGDGINSFAISQVLDAFGNVRSLTYPTGPAGSPQVVTTTPDQFGRPQTVSSGANFGQWIYDTGTFNTHTDNLIYGNGATTATTTTRGETVRVTHSVVSGLPNNVQDNFVGWDAAGLLRWRGPDSSNQLGSNGMPVLNDGYAYDGLHRLYSASIHGLNAGELMLQTFGFDSFGNRNASAFSYTQGSGGTQPEEVMAWTAAYNPSSNQLPGTVSGPAGSLTTGAVYDDLGRMTSVLAVPNNQGQNATAWNYDPQGRAVRENVQGVGISFLLDGEGLRFKRINDDGTLNYTVYGFNREPLCQFESSSLAVDQSIPFDLWTKGSSVILVVPESGWAFQGQQIPCMSGDTFYATAFVHTTGMTSGSAQVGIVFLDSNGNEMTSQLNAFGASLGSGIPITSNSTARSQIGCMNTAPPGAAFAVLYLQCGPCPPGSVASYDSVAFSKGQPLNPTGGNTSLDLWTNGSATDLVVPANGWAFQGQRLTCIPGDTFYATAYARTTGMTTGSAQVGIVFFDASGNEMTSQQNAYGEALGNGVPISTNCTTRTVIGCMNTAPVGAELVELYLQCGPCPPGSVGSYDSVAFSKGEPLSPTSNSIPLDLWTNGNATDLVVPASGWAFQGQRLTCMPGDTFYATAFAQTTGMTSGTAQVGIVFLDTSGIEMTTQLNAFGAPLGNGIPITTNSTTRTAIGCMNTAPAGAGFVVIYIQCGPCPPGSVGSYDSVAFSKGQPLSPTFGSIPLDLWTKGSGAELVVPANGWAFQGQSQACSPGDIFYATAYVQTKGMTSGSAQVGIVFMDTSGNEMTGQSNPFGSYLGNGVPIITNSTTRALIGCMNIAPAGAASVEFYIQCGPCPPGSIASYDSIAFTKGISTATNTLLWTKSMIYGFGQLLCEETPGGNTFIQADQVGSPNIITDINGAVVGLAKNLPFGERFGQSGIQSSRRFTTHEDQAGSAIYMQARTYLPAYGKFAQPDPAYDQHPGDPETWSLYTYVTNNPVTNTDPTGRMLPEPNGGIVPATQAYEQQQGQDLSMDATLAAVAKAVTATLALPGGDSAQSSKPQEAKGPDPSSQTDPQNPGGAKSGDLYGTTKVSPDQPKGISGSPGNLDKVAVQLSEWEIAHNPGTGPVKNERGGFIVDPGNGTAVPGTVMQGDGTGVSTRKSAGLLPAGSELLADWHHHWNGKPGASGYDGDMAWNVTMTNYGRTGSGFGHPVSGDYRSYVLTNTPSGYDLYRVQSIAVGNSWRFQVNLIWSK